MLLRILCLAFNCADLDDSREKLMNRSLAGSGIWQAVALLQYLIT